MVLLRHDDLAQVIVHTANMIEQDWRNLSQGVWLSPLLPMHAHAVRKGIGDSHPAIGSGARFKQDFMAYLKHYGNRTTSLVSQLDKYDFSAIRAALIAHVPAKMDGKELEADAQLWGWPALKRALSNIQPSTSIRQKAVPHIVCQVSSIATLTEKWIRETLFSTLIQTANLSPLESASKKQKPQSPTQNEAKFSIIFPTPSEIRNSLDGYASGASIHCKLQNVSQRKQFEIMKPHLCHWHPSIPSIPTITSANSGSSPSTPSTQIATTRKALRGPAAPHIKTFIRFHNNSTHDSIDWALLTSANLSTQAWGTGAAAAKTGNGNDGEVRISSYELGVLVWPDLFLDDHEANSEEIGRSEKKKGEAKMIPTFGSDTPSDRQVAEAMSSRRTTAAYKTTIANRTDPEPDSDTASISTSNPDSDPEDVIIGLRMPYDLPLTPYGPNDEVWSARSSYVEPDRWGRVWNG